MEKNLKWLPIPNGINGALSSDCNFFYSFYFKCRLISDSYLQVEIVPTPQTYKEPLDLPVAVIICITVACYVFIVIVALIIRQCLQVCTCTLTLFRLSFDGLAIFSCGLKMDL
jgi:hypothetical protein